MAGGGLIFALAVISTVILAPATAAPRGQSGAGDFIRVSCGATRYPSLCVQSLQIFAPAIKRSPRQLTATALAVSVSRTRVAAGYVGRLAKAPGVRGRDAAAVKDCAEIMADSVDQLGTSMKELNRAMSGGGGFRFHMGNVQTWVSAALTDQNTCLDGFAGMRDPVRAGVQRQMENVVQVTSNALALINRYTQHRWP